MSSIMNRTQLAGKQYRDKLRRDKEEIRLNTKKLKKQNRKIRKSQED